MPEDFEANLKPCLGRAYSTALHLCQNAADAEDLVQDAAVQAFAAFGRYQAGTNFRAWFLKILVNLFLNKHRKKGREPQTQSFEEVTELQLYQQTRDAAARRAADPAAAVLSQMSVEQVSAALSNLPDEFRTVCILYFIQQFSYEEIAKLVDCPVGTVRSRLHRGRKILQQALCELAVEQGLAPASH